MAFRLLNQVGFLLDKLKRLAVPLFVPCAVVERSGFGFSQTNPLPKNQPKLGWVKEKGMWNTGSR
jgi:hypothetical protein